MYFCNDCGILTSELKEPKFRCQCLLCLGLNEPLYICKKCRSLNWRMLEYQKIGKFYIKTHKKYLKEKKVDINYYTDDLLNN